MVSAVLKWLGSIPTVAVLTIQRDEARAEVAVVRAELAAVREKLDAALTELAAAREENLRLHAQIKDLEQKLDVDERRAKANRPRYAETDDG